MYDRDTWYEYAVELEVDPETARSADKYRVIAKAEQILNDELGDAAKWFEVSDVDADIVTFELRVGTSHTHDVGEAAAREKAEEWATEMFESIDTPLEVADLDYCGVTVPTENDDVPIEEYHENAESDGDRDEKAAGTVGSDGPMDGQVPSEPEPSTSSSNPSDSDETTMLEQVMGGPS